ncbi:MAG: TniQ family protein [Proteobacteria bacterium]|nr:hypothetical protein [Desulfobulbaceae bacterium]MBU4152642.1 TniQ family protein [Pseudomonadota bacterium]
MDLTLLVRTPSPFATESLWGFALRVSEENGYDNPRHILKLAGFNQYERKTASFPFNKLATILGKDQSDLEPIAYSKNSGNNSREFFILGKSLGNSLKHYPLRLTKPSFCPHCVAETGHLDACWDINLSVACPKHKCQVINKCHICGKDLRWFRPGLLRCNCGALLSDSPRIEVNSPVTELMAILFAKIHGKSVSNINNPNNFPIREMEEISLRSFLLVIPALGRFNLVGHLSTAEITPINLVASAAEVFTNWPFGYHDFLRKLGAHANYDKHPTIGLRKYFENYYSSMFKQRTSHKYIEFLRDEFVNFGLNEWGESVVDKKMMRGMPISKERFVSSAELSRQLGVSIRTVKKWAQKGKIEIKEVMANTQKRYLVDLENLFIPPKVKGRVIRMREAAAFIGIPVSVLKGLRESGHYDIQHMPRQKPGFHEADLNVFRFNLLNLSPLIRESITGNNDFITFAHIMEQLQFWSKSGKADFVRDYLIGEIHSAGRIGDSVEQIIFKKNDVLKYIQSCRVAYSACTISRKNAADRIKCDIQAIPGLIEKGYLFGQQQKPSRLRVDGKSVDHFSKNYISLGHLATQVNSTSSKLLQICTQLNVTVVPIPRSYKGGTAAFIKRSDLTTLTTQIKVTNRRSSR